MNRRHTTEHGSAKKSKKNRVAFTPHGGITAAEVEKLINDIKPEWEKDSVKYDPRHWLGNLLLIVDNKHSAMMPYIATMFSDSLFKKIEGEYERGRDHLKKVRLIGIFLAHWDLATVLIVASPCGELTLRKAAVHASNSSAP